MNVLLISQCNKRALVETRRILDQFAERRGDRTWQTPITRIGLATLRRMLKKTARKNTAVACHWIRGRDHSELVWVVGDARRFNEQGAVPTNTTEQDVLRYKDENDWFTAEDIRWLAVLGSLFHDLGKASRAFQEKLTARSRQPVADAYRHEWVSLRLFEAFVGSDQEDASWLNRLSQCDASFSELCLARLVRDDEEGARSPFRTGHLPPLARAIGWLILTHHRLPVCRGEFNAVGLQRLLSPVLSDWNGARPEATERERRACWEFPRGLPFASRDWCRRVQDCARSMLARPGLCESGQRYLDDPYVMHLSRLALMLADHHYSSQDVDPRYGDPLFPLHANTDRKTGDLKQRLDEHLGGVASHARRIIRALPRLERDLPRIARYKSFQRRTVDDRFRWQDRAYDLAVSLRHRSAEQGFFGVNMASTGCGKTLANGRILYGLAEPQKGARFTIALGLRTLTLQTGEAYRERLGLGSEDLGVLVGGGAVRELFELKKGKEPSLLARSGSESAEDLLCDDSHVHYDGSLADSPLSRWLTKNPDAQKLLHAPVLACTIDHLVPATESLRGGRQIAPMLRLLTSDLVLDEPDDFDLADLPALSRLVHWAGMLGSRIVLSSATLPPALIHGLFSAYLEGRRAFQRNRGVPGRPLSVPCAWFDEFRCVAHQAAAAEAFSAAHADFVDRRVVKLREMEPRRKARLVSLSSPSTAPDAVCLAFVERLPEWMMELHQEHHTVDPKTGTRASFGIVRMANIEPLINVAQGLYAQGATSGTRLHLCVYHARHPLVMRSVIEEQLDRVLRRDNPLAVFDENSIRNALDTYAEPDQIFVVLASPVAEVGRDHDYDWAIVEPSSMRSIIQLAGRIRRHRAGLCGTANLLLLTRNLRALRGEKRAYVRPGFEQDLILKTHTLEDLLVPEQLSPLDASPRIRERPTLHPSENLVDLEHQSLRSLMSGDKTASTTFTVPDWWRTPASLTGVLQAKQRFRAGPVEETFALLPGDDGDDGQFVFARRDETGWTRVGNLCRERPLVLGPNVHAWGPSDYRTQLDELATRLDRELAACATRFGTVQLRPTTQGWEYHPALGFKATL